MREAGAVIPHTPVRLIKTETAPARRLGVCVPEPSPFAPYRAQNLHYRGKQEPVRSTFSYPELWRGNPFGR